MRPDSPFKRGTSGYEADLRIQTICLLILSTLALAVAAHWLSSVLIPFIFSTFIAIMLGPLIDFQTQRLKTPRWLAISTTLLTGITLIVVTGMFVSASVAQLADKSTDYQKEVESLLSLVLQKLPLERFHTDVRSLLEHLMNAGIEALRNALGTIINTIFSILSQGTVVMIFLVFILSGGSEQPQGIWAEIKDNVQYYIVTKTLLSLSTAASTGFILNILGVDLALVFALFAFVLTFIPNIGAIIATLLPLPVVLVSPELSFTAKVMSIALPGTIYFIVGNIIEPKIMGRSLKLDPIAILLSLIFFSVIWGSIGMLLATPLTSVAKILLERFELTRPVAEIMEGRLRPLPKKEG